MNEVGIGKQIGLGRVYDQNACLADSLLQVLVAKSILPLELLQDIFDTIRRRRLVCASARQDLVNHADYRLHPRWRDNHGVEVMGDGVEHDNADLEHEVHSEALVLFFLEFFQSEYSMRPRGFKFVVYSRFDSEEIRPHDLAHTFGVEEDVPGRGAPIPIELYNNTGDGITGFHYDPVFTVSEHDPRTNSSVEKDSNKNVGSRASGSKDDVSSTLGSPFSQSQQPGAQPPPLPHDAPRPPKSRRISGKQSAPASEGDNTLKGSPNPDPFVAPTYNLSCAKNAPEADRRTILQHALEELAETISDTPTLP